MTSIDTWKILKMLDELRPVEQSQKQLESFKTALEYAKSRYDKGFELYTTAIERMGFVNNASTVLDAGCGAGHWSLALSKLNHSVVGIDPCQEYVEIARFVAANFPDGHRALFCKSKAEEISYPDKYFDSVVCHGALMFTDHDVALHSFTRVLQEQGRLYIGYSGLGWYLMYLIWWGAFCRDHDQALAGIRVLSDSFKFELGFPNKGWLSMPSTSLCQLLDSLGYKYVFSPGVQEGISTFLGFEATYDLVVEKVNSVDYKSWVPDSTNSLENQILNQIKFGNLSFASCLLDLYKKDLESKDSYKLLQTRLLLKQNRIDEACTLAEGLISKSYETSLIKAICAHASRDFELSLQYYSQIKTSESSEDLQYLIAECYREQGDLKTALRMFEKMLDSYPNSFQSWVGILSTAYQLNESDRLYELTKCFLENRRSVCSGDSIDEIDMLLEKLPQAKQGLINYSDRNWVKHSDLELELYNQQIQKLRTKMNIKTDNSNGEASLQPSRKRFKSDAYTQQWQKWHPGPGSQHVMTLRMLLEDNCRSVIDLGCGNGQFLYMCKQCGMTTEGLELSAGGVLTAKERYQIDVKQFDLDRFDLRLPYEDNCFDYSVTIGPPESIFEMQAFLQEVLRIGKKTILVVPNYGYISFRLNMLLNGSHPALTDPNVAYNFITKKWIEYHIQKAGAEILSVNYAFPHGFEELTSAPGGLPQSELFREFESEPTKELPSKYLFMDRLCRRFPSLLAKFYIYQLN